MRPATHRSATRSLAVLVAVAALLGAWVGDACAAPASGTPSQLWSTFPLGPRADPSVSEREVVSLEGAAWRALPPPGAVAATGRDASDGGSPLDHPGAMAVVATLVAAVLAAAMMALHGRGRSGGSPPGQRRSRRLGPDHRIAHDAGPIRRVTREQREGVIALVVCGTAAAIVTFLVAVYR